MAHDGGKAPSDLFHFTPGRQGFADGTIPKAAITWQEEQSRAAFQSGKLIFLRNWAYVYNRAQKTDGSSKGAGSSRSPRCLA